MRRALILKIALWLIPAYFSPVPLLAEEIGIAENPGNSFGPDREIEFEPVESQEGWKDPSGSWRFDSVNVVIRSFGTSSQSQIRIRGRLKGEGKVYCEDRSFPIGEDGGFEIEVPYSGSRKRLDLARIAPSGEIAYQSLHFRMKVPSTQDSRTVPESIPVVEFNRDLDRRAYFALGTGISAIRYSQSDSRYTDYRSTVWSVKGAFNYFIAPPVWDLGLSGFVNAGTLSSNARADVRFIGVNARVGYVFPGIEKPWRLALYGGWYYSTMVANDLSFGYRHISGPQIYPTLRRAFSNGSALSGYLKYSPIADRIGLLDLGNSEWAAGLSWLQPIGGNPYLFSVDHARLRFSIQGRSIDTGSWSLGFGRAF